MITKLNGLNKLLDDISRGFPNRLAIIHGEEYLTYGALNNEVNVLMRFLRQHSVGPDVLVGVLLKRTTQMIIALISVLKAGGAYVPLEPDTPLARLQQQLNELGNILLITENQFLHKLNDFNGLVVCLDEAVRPSKYAPGEPFQPEVSESAAYVLYTSGSTGAPKGVVISRRNLINYTNAICLKLRFDQRESLNFALISPLSADIGNTAIFPALASGGCLNIFPPDAIQDASKFAYYMSNYHIDVLKITPSHLKSLIVERNISSSLPAKCLILGGDALAFELCERIEKSEAKCQIINHYGPTESTVGALCTKVDSLTYWKSIASASTVPVGKPLENMQAYITDSNLTPILPGAHGELYIGGCGVGRGYLKSPEVTAQRFVPDSFSMQAGSRLYKTGDLCRSLPDGNIEFIGRVDRQLKIRGFRVDLLEIENAILKHNMVSNVAVKPWGSHEKKSLVAYIVAAHSPLEPALSAQAVRAFLQDWLPAYMIPARFIFLDRLPMTLSGKVDYQNLPEPVINRSKNDESLQIPEGWGVTCLIEAWQECLGVEYINVTDNFFDLGGDSIIAIQISARLYQNNIYLSPQQFFERPTIAALSDVLQSLLQRMEFNQAEATGPAPLSPAQKWFFEQEFTEAHHWNQAILLEVEGQLDCDNLDRAVRCLIKHHDALRLRFHGKEIKDLQQVHAPFSDSYSPFQFESLECHTAMSRSELIELLCAKAQRSLNLLDGPLLRVVLFRSPGEADRLLIVIHHLVVDGVSWRILLEDIQTAYQQLIDGSPVRLPEKTSSFKDWSGALDRMCRSASVEQELPYWRKLSNYSTELPLDYQGVNSEESARTIWAYLSPEESRMLFNRVSSKISLQDILITAMARVISSWTGRESFLADIEGHGRENIDPYLNITRTVGWFTSRFPLLLEALHKESFEDSLFRITQTIEMLPHRGMFLGALRYLHPDIDISREMKMLPNPNICFNYLGVFKQNASSVFNWNVASESPGPTRSPLADRGHQLKLTARVIKDQLCLDWSFSENLHSRFTIEALAESYLDELRKYIDPAAEKTCSRQTQLIYQEQLSSGLLLGAPAEKASRRQTNSIRVEAIRPSHVLLTGATGYLGIHLLNELLEQSRVHVHCLIRASGRSDAVARLIELLGWYFPRKNYRELMPLLHPIAGDIRLPWLGLEPDEYRRLASLVDVIYHAAADVRLIGNPDELMKTNATGTRHVLDFTAAVKRKSLHHISTLSVAGAPSGFTPTSFSEGHFEIGQRLSNPYEQSKYAAEQILREAMASGARICIYRTGHIAANSRTGRFQKNIAQNRIYLNLKAYARLNAAPYLPAARIGFSYVDIVAKSIVALSQLPGVQKETYHVENAHTLTHYELIRVLQAFGYSIVMMLPEDYRRRVAELGEDPSRLYGLYNTWGHNDDLDWAPKIEYDCSTTIARLSQLGISFSAPDVAWLRSVVQHCIDVEFLQAPLYWSRVSNHPDILSE